MPGYLEMEACIEVDGGTLRRATKWKLTSSTHGGSGKGKLCQFPCLGGVHPPGSITANRWIASVLEQNIDSSRVTFETLSSEFITFRCDMYI